MWYRSFLSSLKSSFSGGVYDLGALIYDLATVIAGNHASTSNDDLFIVRDVRRTVTLKRASSSTMRTRSSITIRVN
jgi:hypothetical protein